MGSRIGVPMLPLRINQSKRYGQSNMVASMDGDIERSNCHIIEVSSRNIDAYIFVVLLELEVCQLDEYSAC